MGEDILKFNSCRDLPLEDRNVLEGKRVTGTLRHALMEGYNLTKARLENLDLRDANLKNSSFFAVNIKHVDFRGANLTRVDLAKVTGLDTARFDDDTVLYDVELDEISQVYPIVARRLKRYRYAGAFKREHPFLYWPWQVSCACGRSWIRLLSLGVTLTFLFGLFYYLGSAKSEPKWLPKLTFNSFDTTTLGEASLQESELHNSNSDWRLGVCCLQFSAMTFVGFNMAGAMWSDMWTGFWVTAEAWIGLAFIGILITVIAVTMTARE